MNYGLQKMKVLLLQMKSHILRGNLFLGKKAIKLIL
ncbi:Protein of unknown function [Gryllus bimaculatus]|nr:Protein of unknown function [Gryllus bimaculatus]